MTARPFRSTTLADEGATAAFAAGLAPLLRPGDSVLLDGDLGAGKSTLARALIRARSGLPELEVPSPTFTLVQVYDLADLALFHYDLYRLGGPEELAELGFAEALDTGAVLVEWPDRLGSERPDDALVLRLEPDDAAGPSARRLTAEGPAAWMDRLAGIDWQGIDWQGIDWQGID